VNADPEVHAIYSLMSTKNLRMLLAAWRYAIEKGGTGAAASDSRAYPLSLLRSPLCDRSAWSVDPRAPALRPGRGLVLRRSSIPDVA
jgi:hypothetical protein